jgi:hypothetical protein
MSAIDNLVDYILSVRTPERELENDELLVLLPGAVVEAALAELAKLRDLADLVPELLSNPDIPEDQYDCFFCGVTYSHKEAWSETNNPFHCTNPDCPAVRARKAMEDGSRCKVCGAEACIFTPNGDYCLDHEEIAMAEKLEITFTRYENGRWGYFMDSPKASLQDKGYPNLESAYQRVLVVLEAGWPDNGDAWRVKAGPPPNNFV